MIAFLHIKMQVFLTIYSTNPYHDVGQQNFTKERRVGCPNIDKEI